MRWLWEQFKLGAGVVVGLGLLVFACEGLMDACTHNRPLPESMQRQGGCDP